MLKDKISDIFQGAKGHKFNSEDIGVVNDHRMVVEPLFQAAVARSKALF